MSDFLILGPVLSTGEGYAYQSWMPGRGLHTSAVYQRIEQAYYDRRATVRGLKMGEVTVMDLGTKDAFEDAVKRRTVH